MNINWNGLPALDGEDFDHLRQMLDEPPNPDDEEFARLRQLLDEAGRILVFQPDDDHFTRWRAFRDRMTDDEAFHALLDERA